jgi:flagellar M-ring protein FliF
MAGFKVSFLEDWRRLSTRNQIVAIAAVFGVIATFGFLIQSARAPHLALLYSGLDATSSGEILEALEAANVAYDVRGDAIFVDEGRRDSIRMTLAQKGLPQQGQAGFELLDDMNGFATTSDMFDATYWRAKEGELARTIIATPGVKSARVHIAAPKRSAFSRSAPAASAVVTVTMARGRVRREHAEAMRFVVALAVPDLSPEHVAVIDSNGGVVLAPGSNDLTAELAASVGDRESEIESDLINLLEARVGVGNARVKVAIDVSHEQETLFERVLDPQRRIMMNRESTEILESGSDGNGVVTVASNLPEGDVDATSAPGQSKRNETTESTKFDVSETRRETVSSPGAIKRVQVAVLINETPEAEADSKAASSARSPEELESLKKLVSAAVGFDASRGDVVTIAILPFDKPTPAGEQASTNPIVDFLSVNFMSILKLVVPALVSIILALFVLKPVLASVKSAPSLEAGAVQPRAALEAPPPQQQPTPVDEMRRIASEQQAASTAVLKNWLEKSENAA